MKVYLDDDDQWRPTPPGWVRTHTPAETIELLKTGQVTHLDLDHDLGLMDEDGNDVLVWIEREVHLNGFRPPMMKAHTANSVAFVEMSLAIQSIGKHAGIDNIWRDE